MIRFARDFRLIPLVLLATICLFVLKVSGIVFDGGYTLADRLRERAKPPGLTVTTADSVPASPKIVMADNSPPPDKPDVKVPWAQEMFNFNGPASKDDVTGSVGERKDAAMPIDQSRVPKDDMSDITGSSGHGDGESKPAADAGPPLKTSEKPPAPAKLDVGGDTFQLGPGKINSPGERAILGHLQDRRQELDTRQRELDMRESLIKAAEKRLEAKVQELKDIEQRIKVASGARDKAEADRFKGIVAMYENMKPKDAARIFNKLDMRVLIEVASALKSRSMAEIMANMTSEAAEKLTIEMANRASAQAPPQEGGQLPKIEGKPGDG
jgi:flagellar motility protein MotE (MotC chaperone)